MNIDVFKRVFALLLFFTFLLPGAVAAEVSSTQDLDAFKVTPSGSAGPLDGPDLENAIATGDGRIRVIVELEEPPLALYSGGAPGLAATALETSGSQKLDIASQNSAAYINHLASAQANFAASLTAAAPSAGIDFTYQVAFNGMSMAISPDEVDHMSRIPGVKAVYPDSLRHVQMDSSLPLINAPAVWSTLGGQDEAGAGMFIAVVDTGIWADHPMFSADGFSMPQGFPKGYCSSNSADPDFQCSGKIVAARYYNPVFPVHPEEALSPLDIHGHGSHTAGTAAGNSGTVTDTSLVNGPIEISGVAPAAYLMVYKGLFATGGGGGSGSDSMLLAALNDALADGADVVNNSWGGGPGDPGFSPFNTAVKSLTASGVVVVFSAGNSGPNPSTINCPGCIAEAITVGASTTQRRFIKTLDVLSPTPVPGHLTGIELQPSDGPSAADDLAAPIVYAGTADPSNENGCSAFPNGTTFNGQIALIKRGACNFSTKVYNADAAGALAALVYNDLGDELVKMAVGPADIPSYFLGKTSGDALVGWLSDNDTAIARINSSVTLAPVTPDTLASFSSTGPNGDLQILKPDLVAPGVEILSAYSPALTGQSYTQISGTSMAAPHVAGGAALLKQIHPSWSVSQIRSALTSTSVQTVVQPDGFSPATPFQMGAGRIDLERAGEAGLTFDSHSFTSDDCKGACTWTGALKNVGETTATWIAKTETQGGPSLSVFPSTITLAPQEEAEFTIQADVGTLALGQWHFSGLTWSEASGAYSDAFLPLAVLPSDSVEPAALSIQVDKSTAGPGDTLQYTITLANNTFETAPYRILDPIPTHTSFIEGSASGGLVFDSVQNTLNAEVTVAGRVLPDDMPPSVSMTFSVLVDPVEANETVITNTVWANNDTEEAFSASVSTTVLGSRVFIPFVTSRQIP